MMCTRGQRALPECYLRELLYSGSCYETDDAESGTFEKQLA